MDRFIIILIVLLLAGDFTVLATYVFAAYILSKLLEPKTRKTRANARRR